jgi:hypothetical protein
VKNTYARERLTGKSRAVNEPTCRICGQTDGEHCVFEAQRCPCDDRTWADRPGPICSLYVGDGVKNCTTCEHDAECHEARS